jgi:hypothetical protein
MNLSDVRPRGYDVSGEVSSDGNVRLEGEGESTEVVEIEVSDNEGNIFKDSFFVLVIHKADLVEEDGV